jgi:hypothetical protein
MESPPKIPLKSLGLNRALDLLRQPGHRLMRMHSATLPEGCAYYVVPGGYVEPADAAKIIARPDVSVFDDGLFPHCEQSWKLGNG